jgi:RIO kinase 1
MDKRAFEYFETYEYLEHQWDRRDRKQRRQNRQEGRTKISPSDIKATLTDFNDDETDFVPSYAASLDPLHHERQWLIESVASFYRNNLITDVTRLVKGGKEANVYCCTASQATGLGLLAAKLYRPRMLRHLKNDAVYKAGRQLRDVEGKQIKGRRYKLALRKKTKFGKRLDIEWWIGNEFLTQRKLYEAGADVPKPVAHQSNTVLMAFIGDSQFTAPTLSEITLDRNEAEPLFNRVMKNVRLMLEHESILTRLSFYLGMCRGCANISTAMVLALIPKN